MKKTKIKYQSWRLGVPILESVLTFCECPLLAKAVVRSPQALALSACLTLSKHS